MTAGWFQDRFFDLIGWWCGLFGIVEPHAITIVAAVVVGGLFMSFAGFIITMIFTVIASVLK